MLAEFRRAGIDDVALAASLQKEGADAFSTSWHVLLERIEEKRGSLLGSPSSTRGMP